MQTYMNRLEKMKKLVSKGDYGKLERWNIFDFYEAYNELNEQVEKAREQQNKTEAL